MSCKFDDDADVTELEKLWRMYDAMEARVSAPLSMRMLELANLQPGMNVLDLATGRGEPAIAAAHRVAPKGHVVGVDLDEAMLAMARERAEREGVRNLSLHAVDAAALASDSTFDAVLCRWGLMYMRDPVAALVAARRRMTTSAVIVLAVWVEPERVAYFDFPRRVLAACRGQSHVDYGASDTFRYADSSRLAHDLHAAGLFVEHSEELDVKVMQASTQSGLVAWLRAFGMKRVLNDLPPEVQNAWEIEVRRRSEDLRCGQGYELGGITRIVVARPISHVSTTH